MLCLVNLCLLAAVKLVEIELLQVKREAASVNLVIKINNFSC